MSGVEEMNYDGSVDELGKTFARMLAERWPVPACEPDPSGVAPYCTLLCSFARLTKRDDFMRSCLATAAFVIAGELSANAATQTVVLPLSKACVSSANSVFGGVAAQCTEIYDADKDERRIVIEVGYL